MKSIAAVAFALVTVAAVPAARAEVHVGINIGVPAWTWAEPPRVVVVPGVPDVHYAPDVNVNFFTYGGRYYTYGDDRWYVANGNRGPWTHVERRYVPGPVLRVPSRYYHVPPRLVGGGHWRGAGKASYHHDRYDDRYDRRQWQRDRHDGNQRDRRGRGNGKHGHGKHKNKHHDD